MTTYRVTADASSAAELQQLARDNQTNSPEGAIRGTPEVRAKNYSNTISTKTRFDDPNLVQVGPYVVQRSVAEKMGLVTTQQSDGVPVPVSNDPVADRAITQYERQELAAAKAKAADNRVYSAANQELDLAESHFGREVIGNITEAVIGQDEGAAEWANENLPDAVAGFRLSTERAAQDLGYHPESIDLLRYLPAEQQQAVLRAVITQDQSTLSRFLHSIPNAAEMASRDPDLHDEIRAAGYEVFESNGRWVIDFGDGDQRGLAQSLYDGTCVWNPGEGF